MRIRPGPLFTLVLVAALLFAFTVVVVGKTKTKNFAAKQSISVAVAKIQTEVARSSPTISGHGNFNRLIEKQIGAVEANKYQAFARGEPTRAVNTSSANDLIDTRANYKRTEFVSLL